jgi:uncharacterized membrane protein YraQ (UPF0718 family)
VNQSEAASDDPAASRRRDRSALVLGGLAVAAGIACLGIEGPDPTLAAVASAARLFVGVLPEVLLGVALAALLQALVPPASVARLLGAGTGTRAYVIAIAAGAATPGGGWSAIPLARFLWGAGAGVLLVLCYLVAWSLLGLNRLLVWEIPLMGAEFALVRMTVMLPLPVLATIIAAAILARGAVPTAPGTALTEDRERP